MGRPRRSRSQHALRGGSLFLLAVTALWFAGTVFNLAAGSRGSWVLRGAGTMCIVTGDLLLLPSSRGTAEGFTQLADTYSQAGGRVHVVLLAEESQECLDSMVEIQMHLPGVTVSCALLESVAPLAAPRATAEHLAKRQCDAVLSHEFWSPLTQLYVERLLSPSARRGGGPALVTNFMGGLLWSYSWDKEHVRTIADWMQDYYERAGAFASDYLVFSNAYHQKFHTDRWTLCGALSVGPNIVPDGLLPRATYRMQPYPVSGIAFVARVDKRRASPSCWPACCSSRTCRASGWKSSARWAAWTARTRARTSSAR